MRVELERRLLRDLFARVRQSSRALLQRRTRTHDSLWSLDVLLLEEELAVQVGQVDRVEVEDLDQAALARAEAAHDWNITTWSVSAKRLRRQRAHPNS
jgi:hypothetical protein